MRATVLSKSNKPTLSKVDNLSLLGVLDQRSFLKSLHIEGKRAERSHRPFALMLVQLSGALTENNQAQVVEQLLVKLSDTIRETDVLGWYEETRTIGIIFTELGLAEKHVVINALLAKVNNALSSAVNNEEINKIGISLHILPEEHGGDGNDRASGTGFSLDEVSDEKPEELPLKIKRIIDITGSALMLTLLLPFITIIAIVIKLTSKGPILYRQQRVGKYGRPFTFLKFRSMYYVEDHAIHEEFVKHLIVRNKKSDQQPSAPKNVYKITNDPRVTPVGRLLRKTSLDELPQLINVLQGEMSLVGPRPPIPYEVKYYDTWHRRRLWTKPGITGLWQVTGRSRVGFDDMVRLDLEYARSWSLWLDFKILLKTPQAVVGGEGAY